MTSRRAVIGGLAAAGFATPAAAGAPRRIVSLNNCLDAQLVHLADRGQIAALSHWAREAQGSTIAKLALTLPFTWETAEEIIALRPDLVLTSRHSSLATRNALKRLNIATELFSVPESVAESFAQIDRIAGLVGRPQRGEGLKTRIRAAFAAAAPPAGFKPLSAVVFQPNGFAAGKGTLMDEMMTRCGFTNVAARYGLDKWGNVSLEKLLADPPEVLLAGEPAPGAMTWADRVMVHPALKSIAHRMRVETLPERLLYCGGPVLIQTAATLAAARRSVLKARA